MKHVEVSVVMPAFNAARFIGEQIESILAQDYQDFELLIGDDRSGDDTIRIVRGYADSPRVRIVENEEHLGAGATRNRLNRLARGKYLTPCDADDLMLPGNLSRLHAYLEQRPETGMAYASFLMLEADGEDRLERPPWIRGKHHHESWDFVEFVANHAGSMMRRDLVMDVGGYDEGIPILDSVSLTLKLAEVARLEWLEGEALYAYRRHPWSSSVRHPDWYPTFQKLVAEAMERRSTQQTAGPQSS